MNSLEPGPAAAIAPSPRNLTGHGLPSPTADRGRSRLGTTALAGTVVLAIGGGVLLTMGYRSFSAAKPPAVEAAAEANRRANPGEGKDLSLETLGSLTAAHLYQCYLNIGLLADARESEVYTAAEAEKLLDTVTQMLDTVDRHLARMLDDGLKDDDKEAVEHARQQGDLLRTQARELRAYWQSGDKEHADKFQKARQESWSGIQSVLGIED